ncbi:MAG TPA: hypothetical protein VFT43_11655, partial [Candidatus Polarisedimenticolia bacterium]|nr:hypothetical protein [Candidatus Polarisedimenticolia bacterium]
MTEPVTASPPAFKDRSVLLTLVGVVEILLGALSLLIGAISCVGLFVGRLVPGASTSAMTPAVAMMSTSVYFFTAALFVWIGIGTIKGRRWARAIMLIVSWPWLIAGTLSLILVGLLIVRMPQIQTPELSSSVMTFVLFLVLGFASIFSTFLPGLFLLFYGSQNVR